MKFFKAMLGLAIVCGALEAPASATELVREDIRGTIGPNFHDSAWDQLGLFGAPSTDITGEDFLLSFVVDYDKSDALTKYDPTTGFYVPDVTGYAVARASLTLNGKTWTFPNYGKAIGDVDLFGFEDLDNDKAFSRFFIHLDFDRTGLNGWDDALNRVFQVTEGSGEFRYFDNSRRDETDFSLVPTTIAYAPAAAVPEPAGWALLLCGFGVMSCAFASRRRRSLFVAL